MEKLINLKLTICSVIGVIGSAIAQPFGGWDKSLMILVTFMAVDFFSGFIVAGVFKKSNISIEFIYFKSMFAATHQITGFINDTRFA